MSATTPPESPLPRHHGAGVTGEEQDQGNEPARDTRALAVSLSPAERRGVPGRARPRMTGRDYLRLQALERELGWEPTEVPDGVRMPRYDWGKNTNRGAARATRVMMWCTTVIIILCLPVLLWDAMRDWTLVLPVLLVISGGVMQHAALRRVYGPDREARDPVPAPAPSRHGARPAGQDACPECERQARAVIAGEARLSLRAPRTQAGAAPGHEEAIRYLEAQVRAVIIAPWPDLGKEAGGGG